MLHHLDDAALAAIADQRAAIAAAQDRANAFARAELASLEARLNALMEARGRLGATPSPDAYITATEWRDAADQHTFDLSWHDRDIAAVEQQLMTARSIHAGLLAEVPALKEQHRNTILAALADVVAAKVNEAADVATLRESLLLRFKMASQPVKLADEHREGLRFQVQSAGYSDMFWFNASARRDGFTPDKSQAFASALELI